jgi:hypothetical protein
MVRACVGFPGFREGNIRAWLVEILDMPLGSVMSRMHRGHRNMRKLLMDFAIEHGYIRDEDKVEVAP